MKLHLLLWFLWFLSPVVWANLPRDAAEYAAWESNMLAAIGSQKMQPPEIAIPKLGGWISQLSQGANVEHNPRPVFHAAQSALLAIPGHAKYYQDRIEKTREQVKEHARLPEEERSRLDDKKMLLHGGHYDQLRMDAFQILACLPSPEAVAVLGHFLEDPEGRDRKDLLGTPMDTASYGRSMPLNCRLAYDAISQLGIENPPTGASDWMGEFDRTLEATDAWKTWWHEVKTGKRTYRFAGSDIEYGPDGPIAGGQSQKNGKDRRGIEKRTASQGKGSQTPATDSQPSPKAPIIALVIAAVSVMVSLIWYFGKKRSR